MATLMVQKSNLYITVLLLLAISSLGLSNSQQSRNAEILEDPQTQYVLNGTNTTFHCNTIGSYAYWKINTETISNIHVEQKYTLQGFTFDHSVHNNLTLHVLASEETNNSLIQCWVVRRDLDSNHTSYDTSKKASLYVFSNFSPGTFSYRDINLTIYFYANGTPFLTVDIQLPEDIQPKYAINYTFIIEDENSKENESIGPFNYTKQIITHSLFEGIKSNNNYSLKVQVNSFAGNSESNKYYFDTVLDLSQLRSCEFNRGTTSDILPYKMGVGVALSLALVLLMVLTIVLVYIIVYRKKKTHDKITKSANNVCNAMVNNPIYDGPVYESIHRQFDSLTSTTLRAAQISDSDNSLNQCCNSQASTCSEKSDRYVDPPVQPPKPRSKSFVSSDHTHSSISATEAGNVPRSISVSLPKKTGKQRNILNLTLTLNRNCSTEQDVMQTNHKMCGQISAVNPMQRGDEEDNYIVMSPADQCIRGGKWSEISPEETDKYKE